MFLWLWNMLRGFVTIEVSGFSVERFINLAAHRGVYLWDVQRSDNGVQMKVSIKGFKMLKSCTRKTKCRVKIVTKSGLPFVAYRYRKRKILWGGLAFFILSLYVLSSFIWRIEVIGQERLSQDAILEFCESQGLKIGTLKFRVNHRQLQQDLLTHFPDISWVDVHTKGTRTTILLAEIIPKQTIIDRETPCDIVAAKDGLITGIVTGAGKPLVKKNDVVKEGDVLVSGTLELNSDLTGLTTAMVHAYAEVWAKRYTSLSFSIPYTYMEKMFTGKTRKHYAAVLLFAGNKNIDLWGSRIPFDNYDKITYHHQLGVSGDYPLPFIWIVTEYKEFVPETRSRSVEEAKELADRMVTSRILREFDFSTDIVDKQIVFDETPDALSVYALITTNERIDQVVPIAGE